MHKIVILDESVLILHKAKQMLLVEKVKPLIDKLLKTDFRISESVIEEILRLNNE